MKTKKNKKEVDYAEKVIVRLNNFLKIKEISSRSVAIELGLYPTYFYKRRESKLPLNILLAILELFPELSAEWLLRGRGSMIVDTSQWNKRGRKKNVITQDGKSKRELEDMLKHINSTKKRTQKAYENFVENLDKAGEELEKVLKQQ